MIVYKPLLFEDLKNNVIKKINANVKKLGGELEEVDNLGKKLLAYPIKKFKEGYYVEYELTMDSENVKKLEHQLNLLGDILRFLVIKK